MLACKETSVAASLILLSAMSISPCVTSGNDGGLVFLSGWSSMAATDRSCRLWAESARMTSPWAPWRPTASLSKEAKDAVLSGVGLSNRSCKADRRAERPRNQSALMNEGQLRDSGDVSAQG